MKLRTEHLELALTTKTRFLEKVSIVKNGCWEWQGALVNGYGLFSLAGSQRAHRVSHLIFRSYLEDLPLDHLCRNRACVNPDHLEHVTTHENVLRGLNGKLATHCKAGHPYTPENTRYRAFLRICRICRRQWMKKHYKANRESILAKARAYQKEYYKRKIEENSQFNILKR